MKTFYIFSFLLSFFFTPAFLSAQCTSVSTAAGFANCANDVSVTTITMGTGNNTLTIVDDVDLSGNTIDLKNYDLTFSGNVTINSSTNFIGGGNPEVTANGITFSGSGGATNTLEELNTAIMNCGCTTLAEAVAFALPVELLSFTGKAEHNSSVLYWATSSEADNEFFLVEYSTDGKEFVEIGTIVSQGNSQNNQYYEYRHTPGSAQQHYYRLWQYDLDGTVAELGIVAIKTSANNGGATLYPNPVHKGQSLSLDTAFETDTSTLTLVSSSGQQWSLSVSGDNRLALPTGLPTGLYYVRISTPDGEQVLPLNILR